VPQRDSGNMLPLSLRTTAQRREGRAHGCLSGISKSAEPGMRRLHHIHPAADRS